MLLITSGQPSLNPRLVKEADTLAEAGYKVEVLYLYWNTWGTKLDEELLSTKKWKAIRVGGNPVDQKFSYWKSRLINIIAKKTIKTFGLNHILADKALSRASVSLIRKAKQIDADLYIAHNLAALPAAVKAAKKNNAKAGFDAEDLHRYETDENANSIQVRLKVFTEKKYFPLVNYITSSSPEITKKYQELFPSLKFTTILNVFPRHHFFVDPILKDYSSLKLFWFSQHVGLNRGLQAVIEAMRIIEGEKIELHILGFLNPEIKKTLEQLISNLGFTTEPVIRFYPPIPSNEIPDFASNFHIGLATEPSFSINNDIALSNKIFTYIQAGLAIVASDTTAQHHFIECYPELGRNYQKQTPTSLAKVLKEYIEHKDFLIESQERAVTYAKEVLNWETEKQKFLSIISETLASKKDG